MLRPRISLLTPRLWPMHCVGLSPPTSSFHYPYSFLVDSTGSSTFNTLWLLQSESTFNARAAYAMELAIWHPNDSRVMDYITRAIGPSLIVEIGILPKFSAMWNPLIQRFTSTPAIKKCISFKMLIFRVMMMPLCRQFQSDASWPKCYLSRLVGLAEASRGSPTVCLTTRSLQLTH